MCGIGLSRRVLLLRLTRQGTEQWAGASVPGYNVLINSIAAQLVNDQARESQEIASALGQPHLLVGHVLELFADNGLVRLARLNSGWRKYVTLVNPELRRMLDG